jgi:hypothetical protein
VHGITIDGNAVLVASATYTVVSASTTVGTLTIDEESTLTIGAGELLTGFNNTTDSASLILTGAAGEDGAKLSGAGTVVAGATTITGGASGLWRAVGASTTIVIAVNSISGTGDEAKLVGVTHDSAIIKQNKGGSASTALTLTDATIDLSANGILTLEGDAENSGTLVLAGATSVISTGTGTSGSGITSIGKIGEKDITSLTIGTASGDVAADYDGDKKLGFLKGIAAGPASVVPAGADDISFVKDVVIAAPGA